MTLQVSQSIPSNALTTPTPLTPASSDTFQDSSVGPNGMLLRVITTGTSCNVTINDPGKTPSANAGSPSALACPATGSRMLPIPRSAIDPVTGLVTVNFSALTGVTYEAYRI